MRPWLGREWEEGNKQEHHVAQVSNVTKIPELTGSLVTTSRSVSKCDPSSCQSDLSGDSTKDEGET